MPGFTDAAKNSMLASITGKTTPDHTIDLISLHTASPGDNGANEVDGNGYAKASVTEAAWKAAGAENGGEIELTADIEFDGPANGDATHMGIWDGATFLGGGAITGDTTFNAEGKFILQEGTKLSIT